MTPVAMSVPKLVLTNRHASRGRFGISDFFPPYIIAVPSCESVDPRFLNVNGDLCQAGCPELVEGNVRRMATGHEHACRNGARSSPPTPAVDQHILAC